MLIFYRRFFVQRQEQTTVPAKEDSMTKSRSLERLNTSLFQPLCPDELARVTVGDSGQTRFTFIGLTQSGGGVVNDYVVDAIATA
jgi:hypothetical protein